MTIHLFLEKDHSPALLSRKHLHISPICAEYLLFPLLELYSTLPHLRCVQEVDLRGCHQWVHGQQGASEGDQRERENVFLWFFPFKVTELVMSLTSPPKVVSCAGLPFSFYALPCNSSTTAPLQTNPPLNISWGHQWAVETLTDTHLPCIDLRGLLVGTSLLYHRLSVFSLSAHQPAVFHFVLWIFK